MKHRRTVSAAFATMIILATHSAISRAATPVVLDDAIELARAGKFHEARDTLLQLPDNTSSAIVHYLLAVCYSRLGDPESTFDQAIAALSAKPPLDSALSDGARRLIRWAGVSSARRVVSGTYSLSIPDNHSKDLAKMAAQKEREDKVQEQLQMLMDRARPYVDLDAEGRIARGCGVGPECVSRLLVPPTTEARDPAIPISPLPPSERSSVANSASSGAR